MRSKNPHKRKITGAFIIIVFLFSLIGFFLSPSPYLYTDFSYNFGILGPYAFESTETDLSQSFTKLYGFPTFNNQTLEGFSSWYLTVYFSKDNEYKLNQRIEMQIYGSAKYGNSTDAIWSFLPNEFLGLDSSSLHLLYSRDNMIYSFNTNGENQSDGF